MKTNERTKKKPMNHSNKTREYTRKNRLLLTTYSISTVADALDRTRTLTKIQKVKAIVVVDDSQEWNGVANQKTLALIDIGQKLNMWQCVSVP